MTFGLPFLYYPAMKTELASINAENSSAHTFHIPVMGTGFSIDTPLKVAKYGISSVISLVDDVLIEQVRKFYCDKTGEPYKAIENSDHDARAKRITAYLNLVDKLVKRQVKDLQASPFENNSEITKYYEMLPECPLKDLYIEMLATNDAARKAELQNVLRKKAQPGRIDVNIMTKIDAPHRLNGNTLPREYNDAMSALRGYAQSTLNSAIVFSAGINQHLYTYMVQFKDFFCDKKDSIKKIILKVSDYRSAMTQGKFLAKKGLWVSEFRVESGLNCGGHAFPTTGLLMGPILEEFRKKKNELVEKLGRIYDKACENMNIDHPGHTKETRITVQGGICTHEEDTFLRRHYGVNGTGWGTPFLLVPECINVDDDSLAKLCCAQRDDTYLSQSSPMGIPYWNLKTSASEEGRLQRISSGKPGAPCPKGYLAFNSEFTERPICTASRNYQQRKLAALQKANGLTPEQKKIVQEDVLAKSCICHELGGCSTIKMGIDKTVKPNICPGPIIGYFSKPVKLEEMIDHIYGRISLLAVFDRPHMFIEELNIYCEYLRGEIEKARLDLSSYTMSHLADFKSNMLDAIRYYRELAGEFVAEQSEAFLDDLDVIQSRLDELLPTTVPAT